MMEFLILCLLMCFGSSEGRIPEKFIRINNISVPLFKHDALFELMENDTLGKPISPTDHKNAEFHEMPVIARQQTDPILLADMFEGDIILKKPFVTAQLLKHYGNNTTEGATLRNAIVEPIQKWPNAIVPYVISNAYRNEERMILARAFKTIESKTCIRFVPRSQEDDFIHILKGDGCSSFVGKHSKAQPVSIGYGCLYVGVVMHELLHVLGFLHEQSRFDRDDYVTILQQNIQPDMEVNFLKYNWNKMQNFGVSYDLSSILHYGTKAFTINSNKPTIIPNTDIEIGQRQYLTEKDVLKLRLLYECDKVENVPQAPSDDVTVTQTINNKECRDIDDYCSGYSEAGECSKNPLWMVHYCPKSCGFCECRDLAGIECEIWADTGECTNNAAYMQKFCQKSCQVCANQDQNIPDVKTCHNNHNNCETWALDGQCRVNHEWMIPNCRKACNQC